MMMVMMRGWRHIIYEELSKIPLERPFITHTFTADGNITVPLRKPYLFVHVPKVLFITSLRDYVILSNLRC